MFQNPPWPPHVVTGFKAEPVQATSCCICKSHSDSKAKESENTLQALCYLIYMLNDNISYMLNYLEYIIKIHFTSSTLFFFNGADGKFKMKVGLADVNDYI